MLKTAYQMGVLLSLKEAGLEKESFQSIEDMKRQAIKGPSAAPAVGAAAPQAKAPSSLAKPAPAAPASIKPTSNLSSLPASAPAPAPAAPSMLSGAWQKGKAQLVSPQQSQMGMRRSNIESQRRRLQSLK